MNNKEQNEPTPPALSIAPAPHVSNRAMTTRRMMIDVLIGLTPAMIAAVWVFHWYAVWQVALCVAGCMAAEAIFTVWRRKPISLGDCSAIVTGVILAFSMPATTPYWVSLIACFAAIGLGKVVFGGLGQNIFNPAMVGRAFVMVAFAGFLAAGGYKAVTENPGANVTQTLPWAFSQELPTAITQATPMTAAFKAGKPFALKLLFTGDTNGSVGETSALALIIGGLFLCIRRTASWELPAGAILSLVAVAGLHQWADPSTHWGILHHLFGGAFLLGAFFIITDPVSSPLTPKGKFIMGLIFGLLVMVIRLWTNYPEGVMFSVLLTNAIAPLLTRWTIPTPVGGHSPQPAK